MAFALPAVLLVTTHGCLLAERALLPELTSTFTRPAARAVGGRGEWATAALLIAAQVIGLAGPVAGDRADVPQVLRSGDAALEFGGADVVSRMCEQLREHRRGEPVIAPVGLSESWYLATYVHDRRTREATDEAWRLVRSGPAWVFVGDNFLRNGAIDELDRFVVAHGRPVMRAPPVERFTDPTNPHGFALFQLAAQPGIEPASPASEAPPKVGD